MDLPEHVTPAAQATRRIGFIGLGAMGGPIARHLCKAGYRVVGFDLNRAALERLEQAGGTAAPHAAGAAGGADLLVVMVVNGGQAEAVLFGEGGAAAALPRGATVILSSTLPPDHAAAIALRLEGMGLLMLDAPVSGGVTGAEAGTLTVIASGSDAAYEAAAPAIRAYSGQLYRVGDRAGQGSTVKLVNQLLTATHIALTAEALALGARAGVDPTLLYDVVAHSAGRSFQFEKRAPRMIAGDHEPQSRVDIFLKDLSIALDAARGLNAPVPIAAAAHQVFTMAAGAGLGPKSDTEVLRVYESFGAVDVAELARRAKA
ncbi:NAD(P)-dependent oxidoreductase [Roseomonas populi]|uniref:NAD(P)-binding domain-containing protein n=1 Tax=Roseomonas populi TaxID=3121582 RepID=A0ABT1X6X5_9PROT|nr:NAD(P)-binding domain-containing protein [Roseomonas pecuniae]MCR0983855.1 NAD(P)-binding domain-containing protein [Roseomonas pecuniae]